MRITDRLAYSQLKASRSRTMFALIAIILSTALTTTICSFVASGNKMLVELLGKDYGTYGDTYKVMLFIPAVFFGLMILIMSIVVISNVFRVSANERTAQFGILKCVGATGKQIQSTVMYESIFLSLIGIPAGLLAGLFVDYLGILVVNHYFGNLNELAHIMVRELTLKVSFFVSFPALLLAAIVSFFTILISAWRPAMRASKCSAIDCIRGNDAVIPDKKNFKTNSFLIKLFGYEGALASKNMKRSKKSFRSTITVLSIGICLFICLGSMQMLAKQLEKFMDLGILQTVIAEYNSARTYRMVETTGLEESVYLAPIDSELGNTIAEELSTFDGKEIYGIGQDFETYHATIPETLVSESMKEALEFEKISPSQGAYTFDVEVITLDHKNYEKLCKIAGVALGSNILLNNYSYNRDGYQKDLEPFLEDFNELYMQKADGTGEAYSIQGMIPLKDLPQELLYYNTNPIRIVVQQAEVRGYSFYAAPEDITGFKNFSTQVLNKYFPQPQNAEYMETGFSTRVFETTEYMKVMNIAIVLISVFLYSFVALLLLIGFTNVVSTISTNIMMRSREFAVLKSIGMTSKGLQKMLNLESVLCSAKALVIGLPAGILLTYLISIPIKAAYPIPYELPVMSILLCALGVLVITFGTTKMAVHKLRGQNIIETIRQESGR